MSTLQEPPQNAGDEHESATWLQKFWRRYSPSGEFPISSAASFALHVLVAVLLALGIGSLAGRTQRPPAVSSIMVGDGDSAAPGFGEDGLPPGDGTLETGAAAGTAGGGLARVPAPELTTSETVQKVEDFQPTETFIAPSATGQASRAVSEAQNFASRANAALADAKAALAKNLGGGTGPGPGEGGGGGTGGGKGQGGGGGTDLSGRAARPARWILKFETTSTQDYLAQFEGLGATIAFPVQGNKWRFFPRPASNPSQSTVKDLSNENRLYWIDENAVNVSGLAAALGVRSGGVMIAFLPLELEEKMLKLELSYRGLREEQIKSTYFGVTRGAKYDVIVVKQIPL